MSLKLRILLTVVAFVLTPVIGFGVIFILSEGNARNAEKFVQPVANACAVLIALGAAALWIPYGMKVGQKKRSGKQSSQGKKRSSSR